MAGPSTAGSRPRMRRVPDVTGETAATMRMVELLPAPLGPRNPNDSPRSMEKSMPSTAVNAPKRFVSPRAKTRGSSAAMAPNLPGSSPRIVRYGLAIRLRLRSQAQAAADGHERPPGGQGGQPGGDDVGARPAGPAGLHDHDRRVPRVHGLGMAGES